MEASSESASIYHPSTRTRREPAGAGGRSGTVNTEKPLISSHSRDSAGRDGTGRKGCICLGLEVGSSDLPAPID
jgi:hypothetical protein